MLFIGVIASPALQSFDAYAQFAEEVIVCYNVFPDLVIDPAPVVLQDQFGTELVDPGAGFFVCTNGLKHSADIPSNLLYWTHYRGGEGTLDPPEVILTDQFGTVTVDLVPSTVLFVPALANETGSLSEPHYKLYNRAHSPAGIPIGPLVDPLPVQVTTLFRSEILDPIPGPFGLLTPVIKNGTGTLEAPHYGCYLTSGLNAPVNLDLFDQFGNQTTNAFSAAFLCVPTQKQIVVTTVGGEILGIDMTSLFIAGAAGNASWIVPAVGIMAAGIVGFVLRKRFK